MWPLIKRELLIASRIGGGAFEGVAFYLVFVLIATLGLGRDSQLLGQAAPGLMWVGTLLATVISLDRMFQSDFEDGSLEAMILGPQPLSAIVLAKIAAHWLSIGLPLVVISPMMAVMLNLPMSAIGSVSACLLIGTISASAIGAVGGAVTMGVRRGGALLPLLVMPLFVPTLIFGVLASQGLVDGRDSGTPLAFLTALMLFSLVFSPLICAIILRLSVR